MTRRHSAIFSAGSIVRIPFPFVEREEERVRPALIVSAEPLGPAGDLFWAMMITSMRGREPWPGDIPIGADHADYGLPVPCLIRTAKLSTLSAAAVERKLGDLPADLLAQVKQVVGRRLAL